VILAVLCNRRTAKNPNLHHHRPKKAKIRSLLLLMFTIHCSLGGEVPWCYQIKSVYCRLATMLGLNSLRQTTAAVARIAAIGNYTVSSSSNASSSSSIRNAVRALSTSTESLKVKSTTPPPVANQEERIKYFKIYRWDPDHRQKPVRYQFCHFLRTVIIFLNIVLTVIASHLHQ
jgi:hypothetical protein